MKKRPLVVAVLVACATSSPAATLPASRLVDLSLEELSAITVTSVSGRAEPLSRAADSIYVISGEDIRRSGYTTLPEALRLAPNLHVARVNAAEYAISARGFNTTTANKLLVLIDGRTVYTPLYSGTFWDAQDVLLEDVERIEVISGPGGTLWGSNAVNGVINVITRRAGETRGPLAAVRAGNREHGGAVRYGGAAGGADYRVYAKTLQRRANDLTQAGFRADWGGLADGFTLQGDAYGGDLAQARSRSGFNLLGRWTRPLEGGASLRVQGYFDHTTRDYPGVFAERLDTYDLDALHALAPLGRHRLLWGFGVRHHRDRVENSPGLAFLPPDKDFTRSNVFVQDEIVLGPDLDLTLGWRLDRNAFTGLEHLPSARLAWRPAAGQLVWTALSRAVRAPSRIDREFYVPATPPFSVLAGGPEFRSEVSRVFELGYRAQPRPRLSYSVTGFHHRHDWLRTLEPSPAGPVLANERQGRTTGIEAWGSWRAADALRLSAGFVRQHQSFELRPGAVDLLGPGANGNDPRGWFVGRAGVELDARTDLDVMVRRVGALPSPALPAYTAVDLRLARLVQPGVELSGSVQNLFGGQPEWRTAAGAVEIGRAAYVQLKVTP
ncbi:MAG TPA: TonB-dependent receptor [Burkholderiales bacterium]|nr:TonB-dependent receptor [Burkholderiales bacterium]